PLPELVPVVEREGPRIVGVDKAFGGVADDAPEVSAVPAIVRCSDGFHVLRTHWDASFVGLNWLAEIRVGRRVKTAASFTCRATIGRSRTAVNYPRLVQRLPRPRITNMSRGGWHWYP